MKKLLSLIALAGIFAACQPEEIQTAFEVPDAVATIKVVAVDVRTNTQVTPNDVKANVSNSSYANGVVTITGTPTIAKQTVTLTVNYKADYMSAAKDYTAEVELLALRAGGKAEYSATVVVGELSPIPEYTFTVKQDKNVPETGIVYFQPSDGQNLISYNDKMWARNNSEYLLTGKVDWKAQKGSVASNYSWKGEASDEELKPYAESYFNAYNTGIVEEEKDALNITVSAFSYYTVYVTRVTTAASYTVYKVDVATKAETAIAAFDVKSVAATQIEYEEIADPDSHGHYEQGHGHGDGSSNAGGGIVYPD